MTLSLSVPSQTAVDRESLTESLFDSFSNKNQKHFQETYYHTYRHLTVIDTSSESKPGNNRDLGLLTSPIFTVSTAYKEKESISPGTGAEEKNSRGIQVRESKIWSISFDLRRCTRRFVVLSWRHWRYCIM
jgi:hypothetical protein